MSWDLDEAEAKELAAAYLAAMEPPADDVWVVTRVEEFDGGWVVSWVNKRAAEGSAESKDLYAGGGPLLVDRRTGRVAMSGSAHAVDHDIEAWHRSELPDEPPPASSATRSIRP